MQMVRGLSLVKLETFFEVDYGSRTRGHDWKLKKKSSNTSVCVFTASQKE